jgi:hypothetical protein
MASVVIFGDSNESWFGPAVKDLCREHHGVPDRDIESVVHPGSFAEWLPGAEHWRSIAAHLTAETALVVIGLGGNMVFASSAHRQVAPALVRALASAAPNARLVWRGPPPATASLQGSGARRRRVVASLEDKMVRYRKNRAIRTALAALGFAVFGENRPDMRGQQRIYLDLISLHAGGPHPVPAGVELRVGTPEGALYERAALERGGSALAGEPPASGPWTSFVASKDAMPTHVHAGPANDLVNNHLRDKHIYG